LDIGKQKIHRNGGFFVTCLIMKRGLLFIIDGCTHHFFLEGCVVLVSMWLHRVHGGGHGAFLYQLS